MAEAVTIMTADHPEALAGLGVRDAPLLEVRNVTKSFGGTVALSGVSLTLGQGRILALVGENGAGKSTLIRILAGVEYPDHGAVRVNGSTARPKMSFLHQDLALVESMTVGENIALGSTLGYARSRSLINWRLTSERAKGCMSVLGVDFDPEWWVRDLSRADRSLVALARCLAAEPHLVVLDEPTASLEKADVERLFAAMRRLRASGVAQIFVSHRIDEVLDIADEFVVLRNGRRVGSGLTSDVTSDDLAELITGKRPDHTRSLPVVREDRPVLVVAGAWVGEVGPVDFSLYEGEVLGFVGLRGAGQEQVARFLSGQFRLDRGTMVLDGLPFAPTSPRSALTLGATFVTGNREASGVAPLLNVRENLFLNPRARGRGALVLRSAKSERAEAEEVIKQFGVVPPKPEMLISELSGGNQQKVVLARSLSLGKRLIVLEDPTLGVDVGARAAIYVLLRNAVAAGASAVLISSDFEEVALACDRAIVLNRGRVVDTLQGASLSVENLVRAAESSREG